MRLSEEIGSSDLGILNERQVFIAKAGDREYPLTSVDGFEEVYIDGRRVSSYSLSGDRVVLDSPLLGGEEIILVGRAQRAEVPYSKSQSETVSVPYNASTVSFTEIDLSGTEIFQNGVRLVPSRDYDVVDPNTIRLLTNLGLNSVVEGVQHGRFSWSQPEHMVVDDGQSTKSLANRFKAIQETVPYFEEKSGRKLLELKEGALISKDPHGNYPAVLYGGSVWLMHLSGDTGYVVASWRLVSQSLEITASDASVITLRRYVMDDEGRFTSAADELITQGTSDTPIAVTPAQLKLAAETHAGLSASTLTKTQVEEGTSEVPGVISPKILKDATSVLVESHIAPTLTREWYTFTATTASETFTIPPASAVDVYVDWIIQNTYSVVHNTTLDVTDIILDGLSIGSKVAIHAHSDNIVRDVGSVPVGTTADIEAANPSGMLWSAETLANLSPAGELMPYDGLLIPGTPPKGVTFGTNEGAATPGLLSTTQASELGANLSGELPDNCYFEIDVVDNRSGDVYIISVSSSPKDSAATVITDYTTDAAVLYLENAVEIYSPTEAEGIYGIGEGPMTFGIEVHEGTTYISVLGTKYIWYKSDSRWLGLGVILNTAGRTAGLQLVDDPVLPNDVNPGVVTLKNAALIPNPLRDYARKDSIVHPKVYEVTPTDINLGTSTKGLISASQVKTMAPTMADSELITGTSTVPSLVTAAQLNTLATISEEISITGGFIGDTTATNIVSATQSGPTLSFAVPAYGRPDAAAAATILGDFKEWEVYRFSFSQGLPSEIHIGWGNVQGDTTDVVRLQYSYSTLNYSAYMSGSQVKSGHSEAASEYLLEVYRLPDLIYFVMNGDTLGSLYRSGMIECPLSMLITDNNAGTFRTEVSKDTHSRYLNIEKDDGSSAPGIVNKGTIGIIARDSADYVVQSKVTSGEIVSEATLPALVDEAIIGYTEGYSVSAVPDNWNPFQQAASVTRDSYGLESSTNSISVTFATKYVVKLGRLNVTLDRGQCIEVTSMAVYPAEAKLRFNGTHTLDIRGLVYYDGYYLSQWVGGVKVEEYPLEGLDALTIDIAIGSKDNPDTQQSNYSLTLGKVRKPYYIAPEHAAQDIITSQVAGALVNTNTNLYRHHRTRVYDRIQAFYIGTSTSDVLIGVNDGTSKVGLTLPAGVTHLEAILPVEVTAGFDNPVFFEVSYSGTGVNDLVIRLLPKGG